MRRRLRGMHNRQAAYATYAFGVTSVNYSFAELMARAEIPS
jgi:hypothetical protein